jgi:HEAT repeat protein
MSSSHSFAVVLCLFSMALPAHAEKPNDNRSGANSQPSQSHDVPKEVGGKTLEEWRKDLTHGDSSIRAAAVMAIPQFREAAAKVVPDLLLRLRDGDASPRAKVSHALQMMRPYVTPADRTRVIQALGRTIRGDDQLIVRYQAAAAYRHFCPIDHTIKAEHDTIYDLVANVGLMERSTFELRDACIDGLIYAGVDPKKGPDPRVTKALIGRATYPAEPTTQVRLKAIMALGALGRPQNPSDYKEVMEVLHRRYNYNSAHPTVRIWSHVAIIALEEKADKKDLDTLAEYLTKREADTRFQAVTALGALEDKAEAYVGTICDMVLKSGGEKDPQVMAAICTSLGRMKNKGEGVKKALIQMTEYDDQEHLSVVAAACTALAQLDINDAEASNAIKKALDHRSFTSLHKVLLQKAIEEARKSQAAKPLRNVQKLENGIAPRGRKP